MKKYLSDLLKVFDNIIVEEDGKTEIETSSALKLAQSCCITSLAFDSRQVKESGLFFALPGTHTTGNKFIAEAIKKGAAAVIFEGFFSEEEKNEIAKASSVSRQNTVFVKVESSRFAMSPVSASFYDYPSKKLVIYGVTGTEGKSSTVSFIWQLLRSRGIKAGFISTVQYSLGEDAIDNPQHQTTPEAPVVQKQLYQMLENGCTHAVVESSSHGLSSRTNRLGDVLFDVAVFMNVTLEHLEFHGTYEQYKSDKANLFRALDKHDHVKTIAGKKLTVPSFGIVNLEDPAAMYFKKSTSKKVFGFTTEGKAGKTAGEEIKAQALPAIPEDIAYLSARNIAGARYGLTFSICRFENSKDLADKNRILHVKCPLPGAFNAYNIMAALLAVCISTECHLEDLLPSFENFTPVKGRMTVIDEGQSFEVIVDYAHTPSSFETIFPPLRKRCSGKLICLFGSGGERDIKKRPLQGEIAGRFCDKVILTDEDPRFEDSMTILNQIAEGSVKAGKVLDKDLFLIPDRKEAIRFALKDAEKDDIILLLGKSHENSIIYKDKATPYDEIEEAKKALKELMAGKQKK